jgi:glycosyltransferase involved in cell wall biosynthesis
MRILHVTPTYLPAVRYGGPIVSVHELCRALIARGHEVEVITTNADGASDSPVPLGVPVYVDRVPVQYFPTIAPRRLFRSPALSQAVRHAAKAFDLVHLHTLFNAPVAVAAGAARAAGVPYVVSPRGMLVKDLIRRRRRWAKTMWIQLTDRNTVERAAVVHVTSDVEKTELERFGWKLASIAVVSNGVEDPRCPSGRSAVSSDVDELARSRPLILYFGRLSWKKGLDRLLLAFARTTVGTLAIVGTDDEGMAPGLLKKAEHLGLSSRVRLLPRTVGGADKEHLFSAAQVFVLPSYSENFGNTVLEAMRRGLPVIVTPEVGAAAIVRESGGGIVVSGESEPLGSAIARLTHDIALVRTMGVAGRRFVVERYGWPQVAAQMEVLYKSLMN